ncbi:MAG TPA: PIG-L family deacetylase [Anaerolineae bacterium]|nr:PIG-L family deacetylase [Anaerolineae bacterium]
MSAREWMRAPLWAAVERVWAEGFAGAGLLNRASVRVWTPRGDARVLVIAPHPDDEATGCGGTMVLHTRAGDRVSVVQVTDGGASRAPWLDGNTAAQVRLEEGRAAGPCLGVHDLIQWALPERKWYHAELCERFCTILTHANPDLVYAPSCIDFHPEHVRVARALAAALGIARVRPVIRVYEIGVPLTARLANCVVDTSASGHAQRQALATYYSQSIALMAIPRMRTYCAHFYAREFRGRVVSSAEAFWEMSTAQYQTLMQRGDWLGARAWSPELTPYRSLRPRPLSDPLAYWVGAREREQLKKWIEAKDE